MSSQTLQKIARLAIALGIGILWIPASAVADMRLEIGSGGTGAILTDSTNSGSLVFNQGIGSFVVNVATGTSFPPLDPPPGVVAELDLNSIDVHSGSAGTLTIILENSGYTSTIPNLLGLGSIGGTISNGSVTATSWVNATNAEPSFTGDQPVGTLPVGQPPAVPAGTSQTDLSFTASSSPFSATGAAGFANTGTFSLYEKLVVTFGSGGGNFSADLSNQVVPEPSTLAIAGLGALGMIGYGIRRRRKSA